MLVVHKEQTNFQDFHELPCAAMCNSVSAVLALFGHPLLYISIAGIHLGSSWTSVAVFEKV